MIKLDRFTLTEEKQMELEKIAAEIRAEVEARKTEPRIRRYSPEIRARAVEYALTRAKQKIAQRQIAAELSIGLDALRSWMQATRRKPDFVPVRVIEEQSCSSIVVRAPNGVTVEGLSLEQVASLLKHM